MQCLLCHEKIPRLRSWTTKSEFCCDEHGAMYKKQTLERLLTEQNDYPSSQAAISSDPFFVPTPPSSTAVETLEADGGTETFDPGPDFIDGSFEPPAGNPRVELLPTIDLGSPATNGGANSSQDSAQTLESLSKSTGETDSEWGDPERALAELWKATAGLDPVSPDSGSYEAGLFESASLDNLTGSASHQDIPLDRFERPPFEMPAVSSEEPDLPSFSSESFSGGGHEVESQSAEDALAALRNIASQARTDTQPSRGGTESSDDLPMESGADRDEEAIDSLLGRLTESHGSVPDVESDKQLELATPERFETEVGEPEPSTESLNIPLDDLPLDPQVEATAFEDIAVGELAMPDPEPQVDSGEALGDWEQMLAETRLEVLSDNLDVEPDYEAIAPDEPELEAELEMDVEHVFAAPTDEAPAQYVETVSALEEQDVAVGSDDEPEVAYVADSPNTPDSVDAVALSEALESLSDSSADFEDPESAQPTNVVPFLSPTAVAAPEDEVREVTSKRTGTPEKPRQRRKLTTKSDKRDRPNVPSASALVKSRGSKSLRYKPEFKMLAINPGLRSIEADEGLVELTTGETKPPVATVAFLKSSTVGLWRQTIVAADDPIGGPQSRQLVDFELDLPLAQSSHIQPIASDASRPPRTVESFEFSSDLAVALSGATSNSLRRLTPKPSQPKWCADSSDSLWGGKEWRTNFGSAEDLGVTETPK